MTIDVKERLLDVAGSLGKSNNGRARKGKSRFSSDGGDSNTRTSDGSRPRKRSTDEEDKNRKKSGHGKLRLRRRFLQRLAIALRSYGNSASRTEYLIERAANRLDVDVDIAVFPTLILLNFPGADDDEAFNIITVESELDVDKLGRVDYLANNVGNEDTPLLMAYWRLKAISTSSSKFGQWWWRLFGYALSAFMSALLFFNGSLWDALLSLFLGLVVGIFDLVASRSQLFASVLEFVSATVVSTGARLFSFYLSKYVNVCFFSMVLASLVQLLPGLSLTLGVSEMVAKAHVTGTSRIMYAFFSSLQLGFGIAVGENLVFWPPITSAVSCEPPNLSRWWSILWFAGFSVASNILLYARLDQWPGMIVTSAVGYIVSTATSIRLDSSASSVIAAFAVGLTGTAYSQLGRDLPLVMVLSGILLLVPGGIGVQGVAVMMENDVLSGMGFVFDMMVVGLSITLGLLLAKIALPSTLFGAGKTSANNKITLAAQLADDKASESDSSTDEEESMAI